MERQVGTRIICTQLYTLLYTLQCTLLYTLLYTLLSKLQCTLLCTLLWELLYKLPCKITFAWPKHPVDRISYHPARMWNFTWLGNILLPSLFGNQYWCLISLNPQATNLKLFSLNTFHKVTTCIGIPSIIASVIFGKHRQHRTHRNKSWFQTGTAL